jgi:hypothetical protein
MKTTVPFKTIILAVIAFTLSLFPISCEKEDITDPDTGQDIVDPLKNIKQYAFDLMTDIPMCRAI